MSWKRQFLIAPMLPLAMLPPLMAAPASAIDVATSTHARGLAATCSACHLRDGAGDPAFGSLDGRAAADIARSMRAFRSGERAGTVMPQLARGYTDAEIDAIANWYATRNP